MLFCTLMQGVPSLGWRQSQEGASYMHHRGNEVNE